MVSSSKAVFRRAHFWLPPAFKLRGVEINFQLLMNWSGHLGATGLFTAFVFICSLY